MGRKSTFDQATADQLCMRLTEGESVRSVCEDSEFPSLGTVMQWASDNESFAAQYARARDIGWRVFAERLHDTSRDMTIPADHKRIMVDTDKWMLSKMLPKIYGDRLDLNHSGKVQTNQALTEAELLAIAAKGKGGDA